jgi:FtsH-binding integral membrane protein
MSRAYLKHEDEIAMSDFNGRFGAYGGAPARADMSVDAGLRAFMLGVYTKMALGLLVSAALAWSTVNVPAVMHALYVTGYGGRVVGYTGLGMAVQWAPLVVLLVSSFTMRNPTSQVSNLIYWLVVSLIGLSLGVIFLVYTNGSIASTFLVTAAGFGGLSLYGYTTKRDLTAFGAFLIVGLIGLILAMVVNWFLHSSALSFMISIIGVLIFAGLTAYDTQKLKMVYYQIEGDRNALSAMTSWGALNLYLDFLNMFLFLLRIFGDRR